MALSIKQAGCQTVLALLVAQTLNAGNTPSCRKKVVAAGTAAVLLAAKAIATEPSASVTVPAAPGTVADSLDVSAAMAGLESRAMEAEPFPEVSFRCAGPLIQPAEAVDSDKIGARVAEALKAYREAGCAPKGWLVEAPQCPEPEEFRAPAAPRSAKEQTARWLMGSHRHSLEAGAHTSDAEYYSMELESAVCYAFSEYEQAKPGERKRVLLNRLLEAGVQASKLEGTLKRSSTVRKNLLDQIKKDGDEDSMLAHSLEVLDMKRAMMHRAWNRFLEHAMPVIVELLPKAPAKKSS
jgi:hypothetical protein